MKHTIEQLIKNRKSVRTFNALPLTQADRQTLGQQMREVSNPFGVEVKFRLLDAEGCHLSSPVIVGEKLYIAAKVERKEHFELAYGYSFEALCLSAADLGLGTVLLAATLSRDSFEKAMELGENEVMPAASPVGYPAQKRSVREGLMRKGLKADERLPYPSTFFDGSFQRPLTTEAAGQFAQALELARWAPSAGNKQPWRCVADGNLIHFYKHRSLKDSPLGDVQKVDLGIFLCHFDLVMKAQGAKGRFFFQDPELSAPQSTEYVVSYEVEA